MCARVRALPLMSLMLVGCGPLSVSVAADKAVALVNSESVTITATVSPPQETLVVFSASTGGTLTATQVKSNAMGVATTLLTSSVPGPVTVTAKLSVGSSGAANLTTVTFTSGTKLRFATSPSNTQSQNLLRPVPTVNVEQNGALVTSSAAAVTVIVTPGSCSPSLDSTSLTTVNAVQGVASFYGLKISTPASGCTLTATSNGFDPAVSAAFDIQ